MTISLAILGSTGSIGESSLDALMSSQNREMFQVHALSGATQIEKLAQQCIQWQPKQVAVAHKESVGEFTRLLGKKASPKICYGTEGLKEIIYDSDVHWVINSLSGRQGLAPAFYTLESGKRLLLANKESLVCAGELLMNIARKKKTEIVPLDSEHNAILQTLQKDYLFGDSTATTRNLDKIILTASGGPFLNTSQEDLQDISPQQALKHPVWKMGPKISIDSATMMNKGLEIMETQILFGLDIERIDVVIHPQSIIHCLTCFHDGSCLAQLSQPDMRLVIHQALHYPNSCARENVYLDLTQVAHLTFLPVKEDQFPCLALARHACTEMGGLPIAMSVSNELAVFAFLESRLAFTHIPRIIEKVMNKFSSVPAPSCYEDVVRIEQDVLTHTEELLQSA